MLLMLFHLSPAERGLEKYDLGYGNIGFYFPDDYEQRATYIIRVGKENMLLDKKGCLKKLQLKQIEDP